jgi:hypothetical protein
METEGKVGEARTDVVRSNYYRDEAKFIILKVPRQCPLVLLVKVLTVIKTCNNSNCSSHDTQVPL